MHLKLLAALLIAITFFSPLLVAQDDLENELDESELPAEEKPVIKITVILDPLERAEIFPEIFEEITTIPFKLGQKFKKGDLLLKMNNFYYISQVKKGLKNVELAKEDLKIKESLHKDKLISTLDLLQVELNLATAQSALDEAKKNLQSTVIIAPFDGKIGSLNVREYERPARQKAMMEIFNDRYIIAKFYIPASMLPRFTLGKTIPIHIKALNKVFPAKLIRKGAKINPVSLTINLEAEIDNFEETIIPGMESYLELDLTPQKEP
ncbi:MAG: efflux RND transporter periplasmic adaptor subunit [Candidatus Protochlamydia sp.]|nr:efflux RND transporter periplasmic adaptor subunit [Candidatus Protochlamydia sp.]